MAGSEPFPLLNSSSADALHSIKPNDGGACRRRKSSGLPVEMRVGDTGAPGLATSLAHLHGTAKDGSGPSSTKRASRRRKARSLVHRGRSFVSKYTWALPLVLLAIFLSLYALDPSPSNPIHNFIFLSYALPPAGPGAPVHYGKGAWDFAFVAFYTVVLSFTRELVMQEMLKPLARYCGMRTRSKQARFMEQVYMALYTGTLGLVGMYVMSRTPVWYFNTRGMYEGFPHRSHEGLVKFYYLFQAAFWAQQAIVLVLGMEARRKDFKELVMHHILSVALIWLSYRFHFTYIGLAVYTTHDISDFFLATSKTINYVESRFIMPYFALFAAVWIYFRHYINLQILWSILTEFRTVGPYELNWETQQYKCLLSQVITFSLLAALQALNLFWLYCILRIAHRLAVHNIAQDDRSEADDDDDDDEGGKTRGGHGDALPPAAALDVREAEKLNGLAKSAQEKLKQQLNGVASSPPASGASTGQSHAHLRLRG
ncbi:hypothetical protein P8C59_004614 [Phyllachora maydis]|uniref:TLC domain-containing protein n=1 Tax=Phyllachora maydis TaxID=1825666 RepID=A0AAD9I3Y3_9PEZI|nr:hypothetical protein P8C59_004614 [Phyllachora maydis]